jgi:hypothetical protein
MNKQILFKVCLVAVLSLAASSAFANTPLSGTTILGGGTFSPSKNVVINVISTTNAYAAVSCHQSGDRNIGTNNVDPKIAYGAKVLTATTCSQPGTFDQTFSGTGWSSL